MVCRYDPPGNVIGSFSQKVNSPVKSRDQCSAPSQPTPAPSSPTPPRGSAQCAENPGCTGLEGMCCPTSDGVRLGCCSARTLVAQSPTPPSFVEVDASASVTVVSYNLYWWNVRQNNRWSELWSRIRGESPLDLIGFQECEDVADVVRHSGLSGFEYYLGPKPNPAPLAWNAQVFSKIGGPGNKWIASDQWGNRHLNWVRLRHKSSGATVFFANTHGPLGNCGTTVGNNWLSGVNENRQSGDTVVFTGDFNCGTGSPAMNILKGQLTVAYDGGIDQILSDKGHKTSSGTGRREGSPSDHPLIKGSFTVSGSSNNQPPAGECHTAKEGEPCYTDVMWAMKTGIHEHPDWYGNLDASSSFEEFQENLCHNPNTHCKQPPCRDYTFAGRAIVLV